MLRGNNTGVVVCRILHAIFSGSFLRLFLLAYTADPPEPMVSSGRSVAFLTNNTANSAPVLGRRRIALFASYYRPHAFRQVRDVLVSTLRTQLLQSLLETQ